MAERDTAVRRSTRTDGARGPGVARVRRGRLSSLPSGARVALVARELAPLVNGYSIQLSPKQIVLPRASELAGLQAVTVTGVLLNKQVVKLRAPDQRTPSAAGGGRYTVNASDGDLHFCLGTAQRTPQSHIACELQRATPWKNLFNQNIGQAITVSGFFRCMFEHPGFASNDDAHICEIHPVTSVSLGGQVQTFDVGVPDQQSIHTWTSPHPLNDQDQRIKVTYDRARDTLTFSGMDGQDENYVMVSGTMSNVKLNSSSTTPSQFTFDSAEIGRPLQALCLHGTGAARQLAQLTSTNVTQITMIALRNIDLSQALKNTYVISLLAIDLRAGLNARFQDWPHSP